MAERQLSKRQAAGQKIAAKRKIEKILVGWTVQSQKSSKKYTINLMGPEPQCNCLDFELQRKKCKHIYAVEYFQEHGNASNISNTDVAEQQDTEIRRPTYKQNWPAYNAAQTKEKEMFQMLLSDLCSKIESPLQKIGRPRIATPALTFGVIFKVYSTFSGRRFTSDLKLAHEKGYLTELPHYNSLFNHMESKDLMPILKDLVLQTSLPLKSLETDFAVDASGFGSSRFVKWFNVKYGHEQDQHDWVKAHIMCGVKTNIVTSVEITGGHDNDGPLLPELVQNTGLNFQISEVAADKGYSSRSNLIAISDAGGKPFIAFKKNATGHGTSTGKGEGVDLWRDLFHYYNLNRDEYLEHYHKRSNVESTFSMIKAKFGDGMRSRMYDAQVNEVLCKIVCHNICVLIQSMFELGIKPTFWAK